VKLAPDPKATSRPQSERETAQTLARDLNAHEDGSGILYRAGEHPSKPGRWCVLAENDRSAGPIAYIEL